MYGARAAVKRPGSAGDATAGSRGCRWLWDPRERARAVLVDAGVDPREIEWLLEFLENRGEIYFVGDELRITES